MSTNKDTQDLWHAIDTIREKQTDMLVSQSETNTLIKEHLKKVDDHEDRLRSTEKWKWAHLANIPGIGHAVVALLAKLGGGS